jgi:hypothetical protein
LRSTVKAMIWSSTPFRLIKIFTAILASPGCAYATASLL